MFIQPDMSKVHEAVNSIRQKALDKTKMVNDRSNELWTPAECRRLALLVEKRLPYKEIAKLLRRSEHACSGKVLALKLNKIKLSKYALVYILEHYPRTKLRWRVKGITYSNMKTPAKIHGVSSTTIRNWCKSNKPNCGIIPPSITVEDIANKLGLKPSYVISVHSIYS